VSWEEDDAEEYEFDCAWFDHLFAWQRLLDSVGLIRYNTSGNEIEQQRLRTYGALLMLADKRWATAEEIEEAAELHEGKTEDILIGLEAMRELEITMFDDGILCFRLTDFGKAWAELLLMEQQGD
jgi:hypothetical protein